MYEDAEMGRFYSYNLMSATVRVTGRGKEKPAIQGNTCKGMGIPTSAVNAMQQINTGNVLTILCIMICMAVILGLASMSLGLGAQTGNRLVAGSNITNSSPSGEQQFDIGSFRPPIAEQQEMSNATALQLRFQETDLQSLGGAESRSFIIESVNEFALVDNSQNICVFELRIYQPST